MTFEQSVLHLAKWRKASGKSQEKLAEDIGYARGYIAKVETQPQNVTLEFLVAYAIGVGAPNVTALFQMPESDHSSLSELCRHFRLIEGQEDRESLLAIAKGLSAKYGTQDEP